MFWTISGRELAQWRKQAINQAIAFGISPEEVDWLILEISDADRLSLRLELSKNCPDIVLEYPLFQLSQFWHRRITEKVPLQYLVGRTPWRNFTLKVSPSVLIPRPETEEIIDLALKAAEKSENLEFKSGIWVDLGTGSGAIAIGLAEVFPSSQIYAVDQSPEALKIAQENALNTGYEQKIHFYQGSWWNPLEFLRGKVSGMVSNPPYIPSRLISNLQPEVADHEPKLALDGGEDGLNGIRHLVETSPLYLKPGGIWLIEIMWDQGEKVAKLLAENGHYQSIEIVKDLSENDRFVLAYRSEQSRPYLAPERVI